jgi:hypothetical protein
MATPAQQRRNELAFAATQTVTPLFAKRHHLPPIENPVAAVMAAVMIFVVVFSAIDQCSKVVPILALTAQSATDGGGSSGDLARFI